MEKWPMGEKNGKVVGLINKPNGSSVLIKKD